ncbi:MAG: MFS transporter [Cyanobacteria bacterium P01_F01_bin.150]
MPNNRKTFVILLASILLDFIGFGIAMPILPFYAQGFGASPLWVGFLMGIFPLAGILAPLLWGKFSDRIGRHPTLLLNIAGSAFSYFLLSIASSLWVLFLARGIGGASSASLAIAQSYVSDLTTTEHRTQHLSLLEAASGIGIVIGLIVSGILVGNAPTQIEDFQSPFLIATVSSVFPLLLISTGLPGLNNQKAASHNSQKQIHRRTKQQPSFQKNVVHDLITIFQRPLVSGLMLIMFVMLFAIIGIESIFALWCEHFFNWGPQQLSTLIVFYFLTVSLLQISVTGRLAQRIGETQLLRYSLIFLAIGLCLRPFSTTLPLLIGSLSFIIVAEAIGLPTLTSLLSRLSGAKQQGQTLGLMQSVAGLGGGVGASLAGLMFGSVGYNSPYWMSTILVCSVIVVCWRRITPRHLRRVMRQRQRKKVIRLFELLDHDNNGTLEIQDFKQATHQLASVRGWNPHTKEFQKLQASVLGFAQRLQSMADQDGNQQIDHCEWLHYLENMPDHDLAMLFLQMIDANGDGQITIEELQNFYQVYDISTDELSDVFQTLDLNQDGHISTDEFQTIFTQFLYSDDVQLPGTWIFGVHLPRQL